MQTYDLMELKQACKMLFKTRCFGVNYGCISAKINSDSFLISQKDLILNEPKDEDFCMLMSNKDLRWEQASEDAQIHFDIYSHHSEAKFVAFSRSPNLLAYMEGKDVLDFKNIYRKYTEEEVQIYKVEQRQDYILKLKNTAHLHFKKRLLIIEGIGAYSYARSLDELVFALSELEYLSLVKLLRAK